MGGRLVSMSDETSNMTVSTADRTVEALHRIDDKVEELRKHRLEDPDSATDKLIKSLLPAVTGLVAGKIFQMVWDKAWARRGVSSGKTGTGDNNLVMGIAFAAASAAFGAAVSALSNRGSQALVDRQHRKRGQ